MENRKKESIEQRLYKIAKETEDQNTDIIRLWRRRSAINEQMLCCPVVPPIEE